MLDHSQLGHHETRLRVPPPICRPGKPRFGSQQAVILGFDTLALKLRASNLQYMACASLALLQTTVRLFLGLLIALVLFQTTGTQEMNSIRTKEMSALCENRPHTRPTGGHT